jgi:hypothetical protein
MRIIPIVLLVLYSVCSFSQTIVQGFVKDSESKLPIPFCSIAIKGTAKGAITNEDGKYSISFNANNDIVIFSFIGYETISIEAAKLAPGNVVFLKKKDILLREITVYAENDFLYELMDKCGKQLNKHKTRHEAKTYLGLETQAKEQPVELLECYYNGYLNGTSIEKLSFKNGRTGQAEMDNRYFLTLNSSKAISSLEITRKNEDYPSNPFQCSKREMKKEYYLSLEYSDDKVYAITFRPSSNNHMNFSGEVWIDTESFTPLKINLRAENTSKHPFLPLVSIDTLSDVSINVSFNYKQDGKIPLLSHINFDYRLTYHSVRDSVNSLVESILDREIITKGVMYFYDYDNPFILPFFDYDTDFDDYRKMSVIPYNEVFWDNNNTLLLTEKQKENLGFFADEGQLINYREGNYGKNFLVIPSIDTAKFFEYYYCFWSPGKRILLNKELLQNKVYSQDKINHSIQSDLYNLKVQILLDITQLKDSLNFRSFTVFDAKQTFYHIPEDNFTNAFLNIYFDLCEIERRKFEKELYGYAKNVSIVQKMYDDMLLKQEKLKQQYLKDVERGSNEKEMIRWNSYVFENLGIDNLKLYNIYWDKKGSKIN